MSVGGLCQLCEAAPAESQCGQCGSLVCERHFERSSGHCVQCASDTGRGMGTGERR